MYNKERICDVCGETKPTKAFLTRTRRLDKTCTQCRAKERRRLRYEKEKAQRVLLGVREEISNALQEQKGVLDDWASAIIAEVRSRMAVSKHKMKHYDHKIKYEKHTDKTIAARDRQAQKIRYYEHVIKLIERDALNGKRFPLLYYLTNTYLLQYHGYLCELNPNDPDIIGGTDV